MRLDILTHTVKSSLLKRRLTHERLDNPQRTQAQAHRSHSPVNWRSQPLPLDSTLHFWNPIIFRFRSSCELTAESIIRDNAKREKEADRQSPGTRKKGSSMVKGRRHHPS